MFSPGLKYSSIKKCNIQMLLHIELSNQQQKNTRVKQAWELVDCIYLSKKSHFYRRCIKLTSRVLPEEFMWAKTSV